MDSSHAPSCGAASGDRDRLSKLNDRALGNVLSFLPAEEAARAALLSSRWRHVFAAVHTVSLEEPESAIPDYDNTGGYSPTWQPPPDPNAPPHFYSVVSAALIARQRRRGAVPLRSLRVAVERYGGLPGDSLTVDQWVSYAVQQAAADEGLDLDLRLWCRCQIFICAYALRRRGQQQQQQHEIQAYVDGDYAMTARYQQHKIPSSEMDVDDAANDGNDDDSSTVVSSDDDESYNPWPRVQPEYTVTRVIFSCAHLRSLSLSACRLAPPDTAAISLPSLTTLLLSRVSDPGTDVERLVACCPRLADLTLEACAAVTTLSLVGKGGGAGAPRPRLRRLALRCCHSLTAVAVDSSELQAFEYRGAVPDASSFLTMHGDGGSTTVAYCKVDICGGEATSEEELVNLRQFLCLFVGVRHLHVESARLGSGLGEGVPVSLPSFSSLLHLEMRGCLPDDDDDDTIDTVIATVSTVLEHAPNLETLSLAFHPQEHDLGERRIGYICASEEELLDAHHLRYNPHAVLAATPTTATTIPWCLRNQVREINLVHYQGGTAQRALAKFLLSNAPVIRRLCCEFAEGPMWTQIQLMREIKGWLVNKAAETHFA